MFNEYRNYPCTIREGGTKFLHPHPPLLNSAIENGLNPCASVKMRTPLYKIGIIAPQICLYITRITRPKPLLFSQFDTKKLLTDRQNEGKLVNIVRFKLTNLTAKTLSKFRNIARFNNR